MLSFFLGRASAPNHEPIELQKSEVARSVSTVSPQQARSGELEPVESGQAVETSAPWEAFDDERFFAAQLSEKVRAARQFAESDPYRALDWAERGRSRRERQALRQAALEGWARSDPTAALREALASPEAEREAGLRAALAGAAVEPEAGMVALRALAASGEISGRALDRARLAFVAALGEQGHFEESLRFVLESRGSGVREAELAASFAQWGRYEPESAVVAALDLEKSEEREKAYSVVIASWAETEPGLLAEFAEKLPLGDRRSRAMQLALTQWVASDPTAASAWLDARGPAEELDAGVLALATHPFLAEQHPRTAISWAESIWDPNLRAGTVARVVKQWAATDRRAALAYVRSSEEITLAERQELLALFGERKEFDIDGALP